MRVLCEGCPPCVSGDEQSEGEEDSPEADHDYLVQDSPENVRFSIEQKFMLEMPEDFFDLWELCTSINKEKPEGAKLPQFCFSKIHFMLRLFFEFLHAR